MVSRNIGRETLWREKRIVQGADGECWHVDARDKTTRATLRPVVIDRVESVKWCREPFIELAKGFDGVDPLDCEEVGEQRFFMAHPGSKGL